MVGLDIYEQSKVDRTLVEQLASSVFIDAAHNVVLVGGTGTGTCDL